MKRFRFQLDPVLDYKQQVLDSLLEELELARGKVMAQEWEKEQADRRVTDFDADFAEKQAGGVTIMEMRQYQDCREVLVKRAQREQDKLTRFRRAEEKKRGEVVEARKETRSLEKLKDNRMGEYNAAIAKAEEKSLDDLIATRRVNAAG